MAKIVKLIVPEIAHPLKDGAIEGKIFIDAAGVEWELIGPCTGPKIEISDGKRSEVVWLRPGPGNNLSERNYQSLLRNTHLGKRWPAIVEDRTPLDLETLQRFRRGCKAKVYIPHEELTLGLDGRPENKGVICTNCGSMSEFHGTPKEGTIAKKSQDEAKAAAEKAAKEAKRSRKG